MSEIDKIQLKVELNLKLSEDIQKWAIDALEIDPTNELALDICFLSTSKQVLEYFKQISKESFDIDLRKNVINKLLNDYVFNKLSNVTTKDDIYPFFQSILFLSKYLENKDLDALTDSYDDQIYLALEGYSESEPEVVFQKFIKALKTGY